MTQRKKILLLSPNDKRLVTQHYTTPNPPHGHVQWEVCIYEGGISKTTVNGIVYDYSTRGDVFVLGPNHTHAIEFDENKKHAHRDIYCSDEDMDYRLWCIDNVLFLNPLNDVIQQNIVARDILHTPTMTLKREDKPIYQSIFNQIKQEFVTARFFFYDGVYHDGTHFSDREVTLYRVFDLPLYSINIEKVKIAFRLCYSIFDKIAYLLNIYLNLDIDKNKVTFRNIWHESGNVKNPIRTDIFNTYNLALQGLFWLSKDLYEKNSSPIEPEAKEIATIRNYIEHKSFKVVEAKNPCWNEAPETYEIEEDAFYDKTMRLLRLTRSALLYLSFAIYAEESHKTPLGEIMPIEMELL